LTPGATNKRERVRRLQVIHLIDFNYGPGHSWRHTLEEAPDKCSAVSLKVVGNVVLEWAPSQK
jgi:hypothetical protein